MPSHDSFKTTYKSLFWNTHCFELPNTIQFLIANFPNLIIFKNQMQQVVA